MLKATTKPAKPRPEPRVYVTYWLTRDSDPCTGQPSAHVDVWWSKPQRFVVGERGSFWLDRNNAMDERQACWSLDHARRIGVIPDDGMQCIRVGPESDSRDSLRTIKPGVA